MENSNDFINPESGLSVRLFETLDYLNRVLGFKTLESSVGTRFYRLNGVDIRLFKDNERLVARAHKGKDAFSYSFQFNNDPYISIQIYDSPKFKTFLFILSLFSRFYDCYVTTKHPNPEIKQLRVIAYTNHLNLTRLISDAGKVVEHIFK